VLPITHNPPANPADAIEIPTETQKRLGLDFDRSWIAITQANEFLRLTLELIWLLSAAAMRAHRSIRPAHRF
jgi:hypothetical protein